MNFVPAKFGRGMLMNVVNSANLLVDAICEFVGNKFKLSPIIFRKNKLLS